MTAIANQSSPPAEARLDRAEGIELLGDVQGSGYRDGAALVRRADGQMVQLGPLMYALLENLDGKRTPAELASLLCEQLGRDCDEEHVIALARKLAQQGLLAGTEHQAPPRRNPLLALRFKVLVTNPKVTQRLTAPFTFLFHRWIVWPVVAAFLAVIWFVLFHKGIASATSDAFRKPELLLLVFGLAIVSAGFHELGHAAACRYGGATPAGMGMGLYMVWPAFYTDVTDSYRLPKADRLRVDLGGLYFNALVSVATLGVWVAWHVDALLLLIGLQLLMMVKNLSPMIRSDGYHILADATGVPDLYAHILPTMRKLLPGHRNEPSALTGRARVLVTAWVLIVVPVLLSMMFAAILLLPRLITTAWDSGRVIGAALPHQGAIGVLASLVKLVALVLPVFGSLLVTQKLVRSLGAKAHTWSAGSPLRGAVVLVGAGLIACSAAWAWWPAGQYQPVRASEHGTIASFGRLVAAPASVARPNAAAAGRVQLSPGTHLAVSMIPVGGATKAHPALFVIAGSDGKPAVAILSDTTPDPASAPTTTDPTATTTTATTTAAPTTSAPSTPAAVQASVFPFKLPAAPKPGDSQALATGKKDGGVTYDVAYSLVTVKNGAPVTNTNTAYALASCKACTTVAVSFQVVLIIGQSNDIQPVNAAEALNVNCPACMTTAIADQIVVTLKSQPSDALVAKLEAALQQLDALPALGADGTPAAVAAQVAQVQQQIDQAIQDSGQLANTTTTATATTATAKSTTAASTTTQQTTTTGTTATSTTTTAATTTATTQTTTTAPATTSTTPTTTAATTTTTG